MYLKNILNQIYQMKATNHPQRGSLDVVQTRVLEFVLTHVGLAPDSKNPQKN
jgi:hypothetical protein